MQIAAFMVRRPHNESLFLEHKAVAVFAYN